MSDDRYRCPVCDSLEIYWDIEDDDRVVIECYNCGYRVVSPGNE